MAADYVVDQLQGLFQLPFTSGVYLEIVHKQLVCYWTAQRFAVVAFDGVERM